MLKQTVRTQQKQVISLKTINSLNIISLNQAQLISRVKELLNENPFLEEKRSISLEALSQKTSEYLSRTSKLKSYEFLEDQAQATQSLNFMLNSQVNYFTISAEEKKVLELIISSINESGFCPQGHWNIAREKGYSRRVLNLALEQIKKLEPIGACAENSWQAVLWQAEYLYPEDSLLQEIITTIYLSKDQLTEVNQEILQELSELLYVDKHQIEKKFEIIEILDPFPCRKFQDNSNVYVYPEIEIGQKNNLLEIKIHDILLSELTINTEMFNDLQKNNHADFKIWNEKFEQAKSLISDIAYRHNNLIKVIELIIKYQKDFFYKGVNYLKPLNLSDIADKINANISTVSRIVSSKYLQCKWGIFPLKVFFANKVKSIEGVNKTAKDLADDIKEIIANENKQSPFNDLQLVQQLEKIGYKIHRRTVAKYRLEMNIPQAQQRKQL